MTNATPALLALSRGILKVLIVLNFVCAALFAALLVMSVAVEPQVLAGLARDRGADQAPQLLQAYRIVLLLCLCAVPLAYLILSRLLAMVETVRSGEPFAAANARRLTVIAWSLLGIQLLDLAFGTVATRFDDDSLGGWTPSVTGWLAVLLLFVLARVFVEGARMREDIAGTV